MNYFRLASTGPDASVLAFGCASIMGFHDRRTSLRALHSAREHGITFFDLARSYGYGQAEALFGQFARGQRAQLLIATKFGIVPDPSMRANAIRLLRGGMGGVRHLRVRLRREADPSDECSRHWSPDRLRASLHRSLRELRTDYVDLYLLHSPPGTITQRTDLFEELGRLQSQGLIRSYGLSTDIRQASQALARARHAITAVQHPYCPLTGTTDVLAAPPATVILNHVFGGRGTLQNAAERIAALRTAHDLQPPTRAKLDSAPAAAILADIVLNGALAATRAQCAVVSMFTPEHIAQNCGIVGRSRFAEVELRELMTRLGPSVGPG